MLTAPIPSKAVTDLMLAMLELKPTDKLLEIGTGTGSQAFEWQKHVEQLCSVELHPDYKVSDSLGPHVYLSYGDGAKGFPECAPFDAIVATCGVEEIPPAWVDQLKHGGRLVAPVGTNQCQKLTLFRKNDHLTPERVTAYCRFVMLEKP